MLEHLSRATWNHWEGLVRALGNNSALAHFARLTASNSSAAHTTAVILLTPSAWHAGSRAAHSLRSQNSCYIIDPLPGTQAQMPMPHARFASVPYKKL